MGLFDIFKKEKKPDYDPARITVKDLEEGFVFDYDLKTWVVKEAYKYDWGNNYFTREFKISDGNETLFLEVEDDDELEVSISKKVKVLAIDEDIPDVIDKEKRPPKKLLYKGVTYYREEESPGYFIVSGQDEKNDENWSELIAWTYYDEEDENVLTIEQWGDFEFEASVGQYIEPYEISNILPKEQ